MTRNPFPLVVTAGLLLATSANLRAADSTVAASLPLISCEPLQDENATEVLLQKYRKWVRKIEDGFRIRDAKRKTIMDFSANSDEENDYTETVAFAGYRKSVAALEFQTSGYRHGRGWIKTFWVRPWTRQQQEFGGEVCFSPDHQWVVSWNWQDMNPSVVVYKWDAAQFTASEVARPEISTGANLTGWKDTTTAVLDLLDQNGADVGSAELHYEDGKWTWRE